VERKYQNIALLIEYDSGVVSVCGTEVRIPTLLRHIEADSHTHHHDGMEFCEVNLNVQSRSETREIPYIRRI